jgi:hypothetical protein
MFSSFGGVLVPPFVPTYRPTRVDASRLMWVVSDF